MRTWTVVLPLLLSLTSCTTWDCREYGVPLKGDASVLKTINELPDSEIEKICGHSRVGCFHDGDLYYRNGDNETLRHELCHVMHGPGHTIEYQQNLIGRYRNR